MPYKIVRYQDRNQKVPYREWIQKLRKRDPQAAAKIEVQVTRACYGNFADHKFVRDGVWALRINFGQGYRVYYSIENEFIILLLVGGNKSTQQAEIDKAVNYLEDYHVRMKNDQ